MFVTHVVWKALTFWQCWFVHWWAESCLSWVTGTKQQPKAQVSLLLRAVREVQKVWMESTPRLLSYRGWFQPHTHSWQFPALFLAFWSMSFLTASTRKGVRGLSHHSLWFQKGAFTSIQAGRHGSSLSWRDLGRVDERWEGDSVLTVCSLFSWGPCSPGYWCFIQTGSVMISEYRVIFFTNTHTW